MESLIKTSPHLFLLVYLDGCGPCNATRPEWTSMQTLLKKQYPKSKVQIGSIESKEISAVPQIGEIDGFPTIIHFENGKIKEKYEGERTASAFMKWIEPYMTKITVGGSKLGGSKLGGSKLGGSKLGGSKRRLKQRPKRKSKQRPKRKSKRRPK